MQLMKQIQVQTANTVTFTQGGTQLINEIK